VRLEQLVEAVGDKVDIEWRSFLLRPDPEPRDPGKFAEYTKSWERPAGLEPSAGFNTPWSGEHAPPSHSMPSAVAGKVAATFGEDPARAYHQHLLDAYFVQNRTVSETDVLADVAVEAGIDRAEFVQRFDEQWNTFVQEVVDDHNAAINSGISGVPAVVVDGRYLIGGAVDVAEYERAIEFVLDERRNSADSDHSGSVDHRSDG